MWDYRTLCATEETLQLASISLHDAASRQGRGGLVYDMLTLPTLCTVALWFCVPVPSEILCPCWTSGKKFNGCQDSHHDITRQCQWELGVHKIIQSQRAGADELVSNCVLMALIHIVPLYWYSVTSDSLVLPWLLILARPKLSFN